MKCDKVQDSKTMSIYYLSKMTMALLNILSSLIVKWQLIMPLLSSHCFNTGAKIKQGLPSSSFKTLIFDRSTGSRSPVPHALAKASLAANRLATKRILSLRNASNPSSASVNIRLKLRFPYRDSICSIRRFSTISCPIA